jgi:tetratricopeptide (TPR) repeat protein
MSFNFDDNSDDLWNEFNNPKTPWERKVDILYNLAGLEARENNTTQEIIYLRNAVDMAEAHNLREQRFKYLNILSSRAMHGKSDFNMALDAANEVLEALPGFNVEIDVMEWVGTAYCNKGRALMELKRFDEALPVLRAALDYAELINDLPETAHTNLGLMRCCIEVGDLEEAKKYGTVAKEIYQDRSQLYSVCEADRLFARINILEGNAIRAKNELSEIRALEQRMFHSSHWETKIYLGIAHMELGQFDRAERLFDKLFDRNLQPWSKDFSVALQAAEHLIKALRGQDKNEEAARVELQRTALAKRVPGAKADDLQRRQQEISELRANGLLDEAEMASLDFLAEANNAGLIEQRWLAICETALTLRKKKDYAGIVKIWDEQPREGLDYQDEIVIRFKNVVTHALRKEGRYEEALALNEEVRKDARTTQDFIQQTYALDNAARLNLDLHKTKAANKLKEQTLENYISRGMNDSALKLIEYFKKKH